MQGPSEFPTTLVSDASARFEARLSQCRHDNLGARQEGRIEGIHQCLKIALVACELAHETEVVLIPDIGHDLFLPPDPHLQNQGVHDEVGGEYGRPHIF